MFLETGRREIGQPGGGRERGRDLGNLREGYRKIDSERAALWREGRKWRRGEQEKRREERNDAAAA